MTLATTARNSPVAPEFWSTVHDEVQEQLALLETAVRQNVPGLQATTGRTKGNNFILFSYLTFSMPDSLIDPVVVGMTFTSAVEGVLVEADASGERTGDCITCAISKTVPSSHDELLAAARELARNLCQSAQAVTAALRDPSRL